MLDIAQHIEYEPNMTILEFGVATGNTLSAMLDALIELQKIPKYVFGFDSFLGLPKEDASTILPDEWQEGNFNIVDELKQKDIQTDTYNGIKLIKSRFEKYLSHQILIELIVGWYSDLNEQQVVAYNIQPASYIHIDCDLYISTMQALDFLFANHLVKENCIIRYDDWKNNSYIGEHKAHLEAMQNYGWRAEFIGSKFSNNVFFRLKS